jgi:uncharacterized protein (TIGR02611 family)
VAGERPDPEPEAGPVEPPGWFDAWRQRARGHALFGPVYRGGVLLVGAAIVVAGVAMLALPGPGWAAIFIGLAVLASEFAIARRLKDSAMGRMRSARSRASDPEWRRRNRIILVSAMVLVAVAVSAAVWLWWGRYGWSLSPIINLP